MRPIQSTILRLAERLAALHEAEDGICDDDASGDAELAVLEQAISIVPANSIEEACIQVMLVLSMASEIEDNEERNRIQRLLWSALNIMKRISALDLTRYGGDIYAPTYLDPWQSSCKDFDAAVLAFEEANRQDFAQ